MATKVRENVLTQAQIIEATLYLNNHRKEIEGKTLDNALETVRKKFPKMAKSTLRNMGKELGITFVRKVSSGGPRLEGGSAQVNRKVASVLLRYLRAYSNGVEPSKDQLANDIEFLATVAAGRSSEVVANAAENV